MSAGNIFLSITPPLTDQSIWLGQTYLFHFGEAMVETLGIDVSTEFHLTMRHLSDHVLKLQCMRRSSTERNERPQKLFK